MKQKNNLILLAGVAFFTAVVAFIISTIVFKGPSNRSTKVPVAGSIDSTFPDIRNDSDYNTIFNVNAVDPAVPLTPNTTPNNQPFNSH